MYGVNPVINFPTPSKPFLIAGITFFPNVFALSMRLAKHWSKLSPPRTRLVIRLPHVDFRDAKEPCIVELASFAVVPLIPKLSCTA